MTASNPISLENRTEKSVSVESQINMLVRSGKKALAVLETFDQAKVDAIVHQMVLAGLSRHMELARLAVAETGRGVFEDKCVKNMFATESIWHSIKNDKTAGVISDDEQTQVVEVASPVGVICGITPVTNPTSTTLFKAIIALKTRNPIIFAFHPGAQRSSAEAARIVRDAAVKAGAPKDCIQWIETPSMEATHLLMNHEDVALVLATGGAGMVKAAYSTGKPALGVGPGNVPAYIEKSAKIKQAVNDLIASKTFDNGMICASEQAVIVDKEIYAEVKQEFNRHHVYFVPQKERLQLEAVVMNESKTAVNPKIVGLPATQIAEMAGIRVPDKTTLLVAEIEGVGPDHPLSREKLSPVLAMLKAKSSDHAFQLAQEMLELGGLGHSATIHTQRSDLADRYGEEMKACRILVNSPSAQGGIGDLYNNMIPSLTLGCGSYGHNSVSKNVSTVHLLNIKTIAKRRNNMQWFKLPPKTYFEKNSLLYLEKMPDVKRVFIVADEGMERLGYVDRVKEVLLRRPDPVSIDVFTDVEPNPSTRTVYAGAEAMRRFEPDTILALGGGSPMDAAKVMWLFYEHPETDFFGAKQKFLDIRKRAYKIPTMEKAQFVCIPTTSGTGSEVTPFAVITDSETHVKYPLADYALTPDVAIVDPQFVLSVPQSVTADTGMDVLTHALEAYVSVMASDYTKGLSLQAIKLVFENLRASALHGDEEAREKMHNASTIAGMAFANAFLGICHSLAHKLGAKYDLIHGRTNAILLPHVVRYNAAVPVKLALFPKYAHFRADEDYAEVARFLGLKGDTNEELVEALVQEITRLGQDIGIEMSLKAQGITDAQLGADIDELAELAFEDQCTTANPKEPLLSELKDIMWAAYEGAATPASRKER